VRPTLRWRFSAFDPLSFAAFPSYPHDLPARKWLKRIPLFSGRLGELVEDHLAKFLQVVGDFNVEHEHGHEHGTSPFRMLPLMDGIPSRRNSLKDGQTHRTFSSYVHFFHLLKNMKVKLFVNLMLVFSNFTIEFHTE